MSKDKKVKVTTELVKKRDLEDFEAEFGLKIEADKSDVVAIQVARVEHELNTERLEIDKRINTLEKEANEEIKALKTQLEKEAEETYKKKLEQAVKLLGELGFQEVKTEVTATLFFDRDKENELGVNYTIGCKERRSYSSSNYLSANDKVKLSKESKKIIKTYWDKMDTIEKLSERGLEVRKRLANISVIERQARAAIAVHALKKSKGGQKILDEVTGIQGLPALPNPEVMKG